MADPKRRLSARRRR
jgi:hypothetical protein